MNDNKYINYPWVTRRSFRSNYHEPDLVAGEAYNFLLLEEMVMPKLALWASGTALDNEHYRVDSIKGIFHMEWFVLLDLEGRRYRVRHACDAECVMPKAGVPVPDQEVVFQGRTDKLTFIQGMDYSEMEPVFMHPVSSPNATRELDSWHFRSNPNMVDWLVRSWKLTAELDPTAMTRMPSNLLRLVEPSKGGMLHDAYVSGMLD